MSVMEAHQNGSRTSPALPRGGGVLLLDDEIEREKGSGCERRPLICVWCMGTYDQLMPRSGSLCELACLVHVGAFSGDHEAVDGEEGPCPGTGLGQQSCRTRRSPPFSTVRPAAHLSPRRHCLPAYGLWRSARALRPLGQKGQVRARRRPVHLPRTPGQSHTSRERCPVRRARDVRCAPLVRCRHLREASPMTRYR